jgi:hypothetical protein
MPGSEPASDFWRRRGARFGGTLRNVATPLLERCLQPGWWRENVARAPPRMWRDRALACPTLLRLRSFYRWN